MCDNQIVKSSIYISNKTSCDDDDDDDDVLSFSSIFLWEITLKLNIYSIVKQTTTGIIGEIYFIFPNLILPWIEIEKKMFQVQISWKSDKSEQIFFHTWPWTMIHFGLFLRKK